MQEIIRILGGRYEKNILEKYEIYLISFCVNGWGQRTGSV